MSATSFPSSPAPLPAAEALLERVHQHVRSGLVPLVERIDREGLYPEAWLRELGALGGFAALSGPPPEGSGLGLATQIEVATAVGQVCGATAFTLWCQGASAWYLRQSPHAAARTRHLPALLRGELLAGSGLSNTVKHLSGIERHLLQATPEDAGGWRVSGSLPWVSNLGDGHLLLTSAQTPEGGYLMFALPCHTPGLQLKPCPEFCALEGTRTLNVRFNQVHIEPDAVLALPHEFDAYVKRIKPGFILLQMGMALGVIAGSLKLIHESQLTRSPTNAWLDEQPEALEHELNTLRQRTRSLAFQAETGQAALPEVLRTRLHASELALRAAQSAALHTGARGFLMRHAAQRRMREATFVAIVTPALKQLRRDIAQLEAQTTAPAQRAA